MVFRVWRTIATVFCFAVYGVVGLFVGLTIFPIVYLFSFDAQTRRERSQTIIHWLYKGFVFVLHRSGVLTYSIKNVSVLNSQKGVLIISNHPTLIDVVFLLSLIPNADCIVKQQVWNNPFMLMAVRSAAYIVNRNPESLIEQCVESIRAGRNIIIFPEGTRTNTIADNVLMNDLKRGVGNIVARAECDIIPVIIRCNPPFLSKRHSWYHAPLKRPHLRIEVKKKIFPQQMLESYENKNDAVKSRKITDYIFKYYVNELQDDKFKRRVESDDY